MTCYVTPDMCKSELGKFMQAFRADRPSEWQMDEFIIHVEKQHRRTVELENALNAVLCLIDNSSGVAGLHLNGDVATWDELSSTWLSEFYNALEQK